MNVDTKHHIDAARQVLVGVVPNPTSQIDQITNALIYKFMDDMDQAAIKAGGEPSFFVGDLEHYAWTRLMDSRMGNQERMNLYSEALMKFSEAKQLPELFRNIFKSAFLPYRSPETLGLFLKEIGFFDYSHPEELGNAYEYLLSIMSSQGDAGQFRTPRHIIDFIVDVVNPTKDDKVLDPACGTGGFLVSSYKHLLAQHDGIDDPKKQAKPLTPDERKKLMANFEGYDVDPGMQRIAQVNMYLHQFKNPKIYQYNTLADEEKWNDKFDVILANPPFMSPKGAGKPNSKFTIDSSRSEVLFVDYIMNHLRPKGRAGIIVPEGIIFQSGTAYKQLRKNLIEDGLFCVVSLPSGVFNPYAGVKTSILLFDNEIAKLTKDMLFVKIRSDGFDLGAQRRANDKSDLPNAENTIFKFQRAIKHNLGYYPEMIDILGAEIAFLVPKSKIVETGNYNLSADRYRVETDYTNAKWPMTKLGEIVVDMKDGGTPSRSKPEYFGGKVNWAVVKDIVPEIYDTKEKLTEAGLKNSSAKVWPIDSVIISLGATIGNVGIAKVPVATKQGLSGIVVDKEKMLPKFLYYILVGQKEFIQSQATGASIKEVRPSKLKEILTIPLPPLEIQERIVAELDGYASIIAGAKQIVQNWKPKIDIDPKWEKVKLRDIAEYFIGLTYSPEDVGDKGIIVLRSSNVQDGELDFSDIVRVNKKVRDNLMVQDGDILMCSRNGSKRLVGKIAVIKNLTEKMTFGTFMTIIRSKYNQFLSYFFVSDLFRDQINGSETSSINQITKYMLDIIVVPLPPNEVQKKIVEKIEAEHTLVDSAKKLIEIYELKTKETVGKLWEQQ